MVALLIVIKRRSDQSDDWEIEYDELEVGEQLGAGGYGAVHKATWKGTEVAVKVMVSEKITKDMEKNFKDEVCGVIVLLSLAFITDLLLRLRCG
jgi:serine/threonine protein kinase